MILVLDTSHFSHPINWAEAKAAGVVAMYTKISQGLGFVDPTGHSHVDAAQAQGVLASGYHFLNCVQDGKEQAEFYLKCVAGKKFDFPHVLDWEDGSVNGASSQRQIACAQDWLDTVEAATGKQPIIYSGASFMSEIKLPASFAKYHVILARYGAHPGSVAPWGTNILGWQFSESYKCAGLAPGSTVDANYFYITAEELKALGAA